MARTKNSRPAAEWTEDLDRDSKPTKEELVAFCDAVRKKKDWKVKILDDNLALKWVNEAGLADMDGSLVGGAFDAVTELQGEARRIHILDTEIAMNTPMNHSTEDDIASINFDLRNALNYARASKHGLRAPELRERGLGVFVSDDLIPMSLHKRLVRELDALAVREPRDFHPESFGKVQDLIHPSLYPYIAGVSPISPGVKAPPFDASDGKFHTELIAKKAKELTSSYAWIPTIFRISPDGSDVRIESYINGLGTRDQFPTLFQSIEKVFLLALPHFEKTIQDSAQYRTQESPSILRWKERRQFILKNDGTLTEHDWRAYLEHHAENWTVQKEAEHRAKDKLREEIEQEDATKERFKVREAESVASGVFNGNKLKVIVKAANYTLSAGREYTGSWHMEGMSHERIVASVIYYYETDDTIEDKGLSLRKFRSPDHDFPYAGALDRDDYYMHHDFRLNFSDGNLGDDEEQLECEGHYPSDWETEIDYAGKPQPMRTSDLAPYIELGTVPTTNIGPKGSTGRILSFPNWIQHKVECVKNVSYSSDTIGTRKILCFFLVDDSIQDSDQLHFHGFYYTGLVHMNVLSAADVPLQMQMCNAATMHNLLMKAVFQLTGNSLPTELMNIIWAYASEGTLTREEAETRRRELMHDRSMINPENAYRGWYYRTT